jgi:hypothetical protein
MDNIEINKDERGLALVVWIEMNENLYLRS